MSKILWVFVLLVSLFLNPPVTSALLGINEPSTAACSLIDIDMDSNTFYEGNTSITINITIKNQTSLDQLKGHYLQAWFGTGVVPGDSQVEKIKSDNYVAIPLDATVPYKTSFTTKNSTLLGNGSHSGSLHDDISANGSFPERCSYIDYQVGVTRDCKFVDNFPTTFPPNTIYTVQFLGLANREYHLSASSNDITRPITTDSKGIGSFNDVTIPGNVGSSYTLSIWGQFKDGYGRCDKIITIAANIAPPAPPNPNVPVTVSQPNAVPVDKCKDPTAIDCSKAGGEPCNDANGPGFKTAIGCIHTTPKGFVKDFLTFAVSIGGGLAFVMMLFGSFQMMTSGGNPQNLQGGKDTLQNAIIGLLFIIFSILLMKIIGIDILNIPGFTP